MKLKKLACLAVAVMMMAVLAVSASAATLEFTQDYTTKTEKVANATAADLGAAYAYGLTIVDSYGYTVAVADMCTTDYLGIGKIDLKNPSYEADKAYCFPYVSYKLSADDGNCIDTVSINVAGNLRDYGGGNFYQLAVYVTATLDVDENGKVDFSKMTPVQVYGGNEASPTADLTKAAGFLNIAVNDLANTLDESQDVYVTVALNQSWTSSTQVKDDADNVIGLTGVDYSRERLFKLNAKATQVAATVVTPDTDDSSSDNTGDDNADTSDAAFLAVVSVALISGAAIVATRKKTH